MQRRINRVHQLAKRPNPVDKQDALNAQTKYMDVISTHKRVFVNPLTTTHSCRTIVVPRAERTMDYTAMEACTAG